VQAPDGAPSDVPSEQSVPTLPGPLLPAPGAWRPGRDISSRFQERGTAPCGERRGARCETYKFIKDLARNNL
jgi:hypothetical protein